MKNLFLIIASLFATGLAAQNGIIRGTIYDGSTGEAVANAGISAVQNPTGKEFKSMSDYDGKYELNLPAGEYQITVLGFGFSDFKTRPIKIAAGKVHVENAFLESASTTLNEISVVARAVKNTEGALILQQRNAARVLDGVSSQQISRMGDDNAAAAIRRVTGVSVVGGKYVTVRGLGDRYSKVLLNGTEIPSLDPDRNSVQMDMFPSNLIDNIVVYKTFSPDIPGDFSGGLINLTTKDFPDKFTFGFSASLGWNSQTTFKEVRDHESGSTDIFALGNKSRALPGLAENYNLTEGVSDPQRTRETSLAFKNSWGERASIPFLNQSYSVSAGNQKSIFNMPIGFIAGITYSLDHQNYTGGKSGRFNVPSQTTSEELNPLYLLDEDVYSQSATWGALFHSNLKINSRHKVGFNFFTNRSGSRESRFLSGQTSEISTLSEDHIFQSQAYDWTERSLANFALDGDHVLDSEREVRLEWNSSYTSSRQDQPDLRFFASDYIIHRDANNAITDTSYYIRKANYNRPSRFYREMQEDNLFNSIALTIPLNKEVKTNFVKIGGSYISKDRDFSERQFDWHEGSNASDFDQVNGDVEAFFSRDRIENGQTYVLDNTQSRNSYTATQSVSSAYMMGQFEIGVRWMIITGLRYERTLINVLSGNENLQPGKLNNNDFLPSLTANYALNENMKLRSSYSQTLARPTFRELSPFPSFSFTGDYLLVGNPELVRTRIHNADLRWEWYPKLGEMVSFSVFYKRFIDPIEKTQDYRAPIGALQISYTNVGSGDVAGFEAELKKNLGFISPSLSGFDFGGNFAWIYARVHMNEYEYQGRLQVDPNASEFRPMYGQSPYTLNAYINYTGKKGLSATISANTFGNRLAIVSRGALPDVYELGRTSLNVSVQYDLNEKFSMTLKGSNLLNPETRLIHEFKGKEYNYHAYKLGVGVSLGLSYKL